MIDISTEVPKNNLDISTVEVHKVSFDEQHQHRSAEDCSRHQHRTSAEGHSNDISTKVPKNFLDISTEVPKKFLDISTVEVQKVSFDERHQHRNAEE